MKRKIWTKEDEEYLIHNYLNITNKLLAKKFGVCEGTIEKKLSSLGLYKNNHHNLSNHPLRYKLKGIKSRCLNKNATAFHNYGGRGISVCDQWCNDLKSFYIWAMENGYQEGLTLDRIDNDGNYCPENCRWITNKEQQRNKRTNRLITAWGETKSFIEWTEDPRCKATAPALKTRLKNGYTPEEAMSFTGPKMPKKEIE